MNMNQALNLDSRIKLSDGSQMPLFGLGVWAAEPGQETYDAVLHALNIGYRHIDTAQMYGNEKDVGEALKDSKLNREEVFLTSKLWETDHGYDAALKAFEISLKKMNLDYLDSDLHSSGGNHTKYDPPYLPLAQHMTPSLSIFTRLCRMLSFIV